jgi:hypothetical protein
MSRVVRAAVVRVVEGQVRRIHGGLPLDEPPGRGGGRVRWIESGWAANCDCN